MDKEELKFLTVDASIVVIESCFPSTINTRAFTAFSSLGSLAVSQQNVRYVMSPRAQYQISSDDDKIPLVF